MLSYSNLCEIAPIYGEQSIRKKSPDSTRVMFHKAKVSELWRTTSKEGHLTAHGPSTTAGAQWILARILTCGYFTFVFSEKVYQGMKSAMVMFETVAGHSFKCVSEQSIQLSTHLQLKTMNIQLQAFDFEGSHFGNGKLRGHHVAKLNFWDPGVVSSCFLVEAFKGTRITWTS